MRRLIKMRQFTDLYKNRHWDETGTEVTKGSIGIVLENSGWNATFDVYDYKIFVNGKIGFISRGEKTELPYLYISK